MPMTASLPAEGSTAWYTWATEVHNDLDGYAPLPIAQSGHWAVPTFLTSGPSGSAWPIINRGYFTPFYSPTAATITAVAVLVDVAGTSGNVVRMGIYSSVGMVPTTILGQGTVAGDSTGIKTLTFGTAVDVDPGLFWVLTAPQGASSPGSTWLTAAPSGFVATQYSDSTFPSGVMQADGVRWVQYTSTSSTFVDSPTIAATETDQRMPYVLVRYG